MAVIWRRFSALPPRAQALIVAGLVVWTIVAGLMDSEPDKSQAVLASDESSATTTTTDATTTTRPTTSTTTTTATTSTTTTTAPTSTTDSVATGDISEHPILDPSHPGLALVTEEAEQAAARELIATVTTRGRGAKTDYDRSKFGPSRSDACSRGLLWCRNGLDTRNDILSRDLTAVECKSPPTNSSAPHCSVARGVLADPFSGNTIVFDRSCCGDDIHVDHLVPLSYAWQMGADQWTDAKRLDFANDPLNLVAVDGHLNLSKSDSDLASWLPPNKPIRCAYAVRFAAVSIKYELPNTEANRQMMLQQCGGSGTSQSPPASTPPATTPVPLASVPPPPTTITSDVKCDPNYDPCVPDYGTYGDVNCGDLNGPIRVVGPSDPHRLDGDRDGTACEG